MKFTIFLACLLAVAYAGNEDHRATKSSERGHMMSRQHDHHNSGRGSHHQGSWKMNHGGHRWTRSAAEEDLEAKEDGHRMVMSNKNHGGHSGSWMGGHRNMDHGNWMSGHRNIEHGSHSGMGSMKMSGGMKGISHHEGSGKINHGGHRWTRSVTEEDQEAQEDGHRTMMSNKNHGSHSGSWMGGHRNMEHGGWMGVHRNMEHGSHSGMGSMKMSGGMKGISHHEGSGKMNHGGHRWTRSVTEEDQEAQEDGHRTMMSNKNLGSHSGSWMGGHRSMDHGNWMSGHRNIEHGSMKMSGGMKHGESRWGRHLDQDEEEQGSLIWGYPQLGHGRHLGGNNRWSRYHI